MHYLKFESYIRNFPSSVLLFTFYVTNFFFLSLSVYTFLKHNLSLNLELLPSALPWFNKKMIPIFIFYVMGLASIAGAFVFSLFGVKESSRQMLFLRSPSYFPFLFFEIIVALLLNATVALGAGIFAGMILVIFFINPSLLVKRLKLWSYSHWLILTAIFIFVIIIYKNIVIKPEVIFNAYYRIPEFYLAATTQTDESYINTTTILNDAHVMCDHDKVDIFTASTWKENRACITVDENNKGLEELANDYSINNSFLLGEHITGASSSKTYPPVLVYREDKLCIFLADGINPVEVNSANQQMWGSLQLEGIYKPTTFTTFQPNKTVHSANNALQFYLDAAFNNYFLVLARGNLKHQQHVLMPAHEYLLGKPLTEVSDQYGLGLTLATAIFSKWLSPDGFVDYGVFQRTIPWVSYVAFIIFSVSMIAIFRDARIAMIPIMLWAMSRVMPGFETFFSSSGWLFFRVLFHPLLLLGVTLYFQQNSKNITYALALALCSQLCLFMNFQFGFMAVFSLSAVLFIACLIEKKAEYLWFCLFILLNIFAGYLLYPLGVNKVASVFLLGLVSLPIPSLEIFAYSFLFFIYICMFFHMHFKNSRWKYPFLFTVFLRQLILFYYIWSGMSNHYHTYFTELMLPYIFYGYFLFFELSLFPSLKKKLPFFITALILATTFGYAKSYFAEEKAYLKNIKKMQLFQWDLPGTHITSTMNPAFFSDSIELIHKYIPATQKSIYMISRYDAFMTLMARKYTALPHFDLSPYITTPLERNAVLDIFASNMPEYIFVDNDINVPAEFDIVPSTFYGPSLHAESKIQLLQAKELENIFNNVIPGKYTPIDRSQILTVYKRIDGR